MKFNLEPWADKLRINPEKTLFNQYSMGLRAGLPVVIGFVSVAFAFAIIALQSGLYSWQAVLMSAMVFAGSSQMIAVTMMAQGAGVATILLATFIINLRHLIMSTCVMNRLKGDKRHLKILAAFGITDESFAIFTTTDDKNSSIYYFLGLITVTYSSWVLGTALGCVATSLLPAILADSLRITMYAMFISLLVPGLGGNIRLTVVVVLTACFSLILSFFLETAWTIIGATLIGATLGVCLPSVKNEENNEFSGEAHPQRRDA
jgi:4-azaleucine resistance transporter AzlC